MNYKLISADSGAVVSATGFKQAINFNVSGKDETIELMLNAAVSEAELFTGRSFRDSDWEGQLADFETEVTLGKAPVTGVSRVSYYNALNEEVVLAEGTDYTVDVVAEPAVVKFINTYAVYPYRRDAVKIRFQTAYVNGLPEDVRAAIYLAAGSYFTNPTDQVRQFPTASRGLLRNYRMFGG